MTYALLSVVVWGINQSYTLYGILSIVFVILLIVTSFITIALTYFQLAAEDHRWWWRAGLPPLICPPHSIRFLLMAPLFSILTHGSVRRWLHWLVHHGQMFPLLEPKQNVRHIAGFIFLRLHGRPLLRSSVDAWSHWVFILHGICPIYLW